LIPMIRANTAADGLLTVNSFGRDCSVVYMRENMT
jgi:hypothetical protein